MLHNYFSSRVCVWYVLFCNNLQTYSYMFGQSQWLGHLQGFCVLVGVRRLCIQNGVILSPSRRFEHFDSKHTQRHGVVDLMHKSLCDCVYAVSIATILSVGTEVLNMAFPNGFAVCLPPARCCIMHELCSLEHTENTVTATYILAVAFSYVPSTSVLLQDRGYHINHPS